MHQNMKSNWIFILDTILVALFWLYYNLHRLDLARLIKSELQWSIQLLTIALPKSKHVS